MVSPPAPPPPSVSEVRSAVHKYHGELFRLHLFCLCLSSVSSMKWQEGLGVWLHCIHLSLGFPPLIADSSIFC